MSLGPLLSGSSNPHRSQLNWHRVEQRQAILTKLSPNWRFIYEQNKWLLLVSALSLQVVCYPVKNTLQSHLEAFTHERSSHRIMQLRYHGLAFPKSLSALLWQVTLNNHLLCNYHANETSSQVSCSSLPANWPLLERNLELTLYTKIRSRGSSFRVCLKLQNVRNNLNVYQ